MCCVHGAHGSGPGWAVLAKRAAAVEGRRQAGVAGPMECRLGAELALGLADNDLVRAAVGLSPGLIEMESASGA